MESKMIVYYQFLLHSPITNQGGDRDPEIPKIPGNTEVRDPEIPKISIPKFSILPNTKKFSIPKFNNTENTKHSRKYRTVHHFLIKIPKKNHKKKIQTFFRILKYFREIFSIFLCFGYFGIPNFGIFRQLRYFAPNFKKLKKKLEIFFRIFYSEIFFGIFFRNCSTFWYFRYFGNTENTSNTVQYY